MIAHSHVLDMIEPVRPVIDDKILFMLKYHKRAPADFIIRNDGVCWLWPQLAGAVAAVIKSVERSLDLLTQMILWKINSLQITKRS